MNTPRIGDKVYRLSDPDRIGVVAAHDKDSCRVEWDSIHSSWVPYAALRIKEWAKTTPMPAEQIAFEEWMASSNYPEIADIALEKLPDGNYKSQITFAGWQGWQGGARYATRLLLELTV